MGGGAQEYTSEDLPNPDKFQFLLGAACSHHRIGLSNSGKAGSRRVNLHQCGRRRPPGEPIFEWLARHAGRTSRCTTSIAWDGDDVFYVDPGSLVAGDMQHPLVWKTDGYISNGRVVLPVDTAATFVFLTGPGSFWLSLNGYLIADISEDGQTLEKGLLAGRFSAGELVATLRPLGIL